VYKMLKQKSRYNIPSTVNIATLIFIISGLELRNRVREKG